MTPHILLICGDEAAARPIDDALAALHGGEARLDRVRDWPSARERLGTDSYDLLLFDNALMAGGEADSAFAFEEADGIPVVLLLGEESDEAATAARIDAEDGVVVDYLRRDRIDADILRRVIRHARVHARAQRQLSEQAVALRAAGAVDRRYRALAESAPIGIWEISLDGTTISLNPAMRALIGGGRRKDVVGKPIEPLLAAESAVLFRREVERWARGVGSTFEVRLAKSNQYVDRYAMISGAPVAHADGRVDRVLATAVDITERKMIEDDIRRLACQDALTGLANRTTFHERLDQALAAARRREGTVAVLFVDLDHFKDVNDALGHETGDRLLQEVAERLQSSTRETDTVARLGGDEFAIVASNLRRVGDAATVARNVIERLSAHFDLGGAPQVIGASVGIALYPADGAHASHLMRNADLALHRAKTDGRNRYRFYDSSLNVEVHRRNALKAEIADALEKGDFVLHYQPQVCAETGALTGVEALVRWQHAERGLVPPGDFIPVAEATGLIVPLGEWVLREACAQAAAWNRNGLPPITVAVNLSAAQFRRPNLVAFVSRVVDETGIDPGWLELEITESMLMDDATATANLLRRLGELGVGFAVDDFGTGYSSLAYLKRFRVDKLKIDRSFVNDIGKSTDADTIVAAIVSLGRALKLDVVAEGVENGEQLAFLAAHGCTKVQGFYYSRPLDPEAFAAWREQHVLASRPGPTPTLIGRQSATG